MTPRKLGAIAVSALLAGMLSQATAAPAATRGHSYGPPFQKGSQGGDSSNFIYADPSTGRVGVLRAYPVPGPFGCSSTGGFVTLRVTHRVTGRVRSVEVRYSGAAVDPYSFLIVSVKAGGRYLGSKEVEGPLEGSGRVRVPLSLGRAPIGSRLRVDFGVEVSSACPNTDGATAQFDRVLVGGA
jgi:hypothetical protein